MPQGPILLFTSVSSNDTALASSTFLFVKLAGFEILFIMLPTLYFKSFPSSNIMKVGFCISNKHKKLECFLSEAIPHNNTRLGC